MAGGANYEEWKADPFLALSMFIELRERFGWKPFTEVFAAYEALPNTERPRTDAEKRDQFIKRFSRATHTDLSAFFTHWGLVGSRE